MKKQQSDTRGVLGAIEAVEQSNFEVNKLAQALCKFVNIQDVVDYIGDVYDLSVSEFSIDEFNWIAEVLDSMSRKKVQESELKSIVGMEIGAGFQKGELRIATGTEEAVFKDCLEKSLKDTL